MRIKSRLSLSIAATLAVGLVILVYTHTAMLRMHDGLSKVNLYHELSSRVFELGSLTEKYLAGPNERVEQQWRSVYKTTEDIFKQIKPEQQQEVALLDSIRKRHRELYPLFERLAAATPNTAVGPPGEDFRERLAAHFSVQIRLMHDDVSNLIKLKQSRIESSQRRLTIATAGIITLLVLAICLFLYLTNREIVRSFIKLHEGTRILREGNLSHSIDVRRNDEIGELAQSLNQMSEALADRTRELAGAKTDAEQRAAEAEERKSTLETLMNAVPAPVWIASDPECKVITGNHAAYDLLRMPHGSNLSGTASESKRPIHFKLFKDGVEISSDQLPVQMAAKGENIRDYEFELRFDDGDSRHVLGNAAPLIDKQGYVYGSVSAFLDITERRIAEKELHRNREWLQVTLASIGDAVLSTDTEGRITFINPVAAALTGWTMEEASGQPVQNVFRTTNEQTHEPAEDIVERVLREGCIVALANHTALVTRDGREIPVEDSAAPIKDSVGKVSGVVLVFHDVTENRRVRKALRESEEHYRSLFDNMLNGYAYCKMHFEQDRPMDFTYLSVNAAFETLTGLKNVVGKRVSEVIPGIRSSAPELLEIYGRVALTGIPHSFETYVETLGMWFSISAYSPRKAHFVAVFDVITERKQTEEALHRSESRFRLLSQTAGRLLASQNPQGIVEGLCREVMEHLDCHAFFNFMVDEDVGRLHLNACAGIPDEEVRKLEWLDYGVAVCGCVARDGKRIVAEDIFNTPDARTELVKSHGIQAYACHPLMIQGKLIGTLSFGTKTRTRFSPEDLALMNTVADQVATAMEKIELIHELRHSRDELELRVQERTAELVRANETLKEQAALLDLAHDAIMVRDMENRIVYWSKGAEKTYGWTKDETMGKTIQDLLNTQFPKPMEVIEAELLQSGHWEGELRHRTRSGQFIVTDSRWAVQKDANGNPSGVLEINRDITERTMLEEAASASHRFLEIANRHSEMASLLEEFVSEAKQFTRCGAVAVRILDKDGNIPYAARGGFSKRFLESESPLSIETDHCMCINVVKGTTDPKFPFYTEYGSFYMNETTRFLTTVSEEDKGMTRNVCNQFGYQSVALIPIKAGRTILGLIHLADKEEHKVPLSAVQTMEQVAMSLGTAIQRVEAEEAVKAYTKKLEQSNQALHDFSSIASHDLQEPLRKVTAFGDLLKAKYGETLAQDGKDYLDRMLGATSRMQSLLHSLLEYSRVTTKAEPLREVNLGDIVREVLSDLEVRIVQTGGEIHVDELPVVEADATQMRQLFQNLIGNALKFHRSEESPIVKVAGCRAPGHDGDFEISVEDNGIGFEEEYLDRIFQPFQRLHGRNSQFEGTGMGLAICKKIVERHGGSITAKSTPGKGTTFVARLPMKQSASKGL